jgi:hypothetical protein
MLLAPAREEDRHEKKQEDKQRGSEARKEPSPSFREIQHCRLLPLWSAGSSLLAAGSASAPTLMASP